jgi:hypothetical protein
VVWPTTPGARGNPERGVETAVGKDCGRGWIMFFVTGRGCGCGAGCGAGCGLGALGAGAGTGGGALSTGAGTGRATTGTTNGGDMGWTIFVTICDAGTTIGTEAGTEVGAFAIGTGTGCATPVRFRRPSTAGL